MASDGFFSRESAERAKDYLVSRAGWKSDSVGRMSTALANVVAMVKENGLEGVALPVVVGLGRSRLLEETIDAASPHWAEYIKSLRGEHTAQTQGLVAWLNQSGVAIDRPLILGGAVAFQSSAEVLERVMGRDVTPVELAELDSPGELELNVGRATVHAPPSGSSAYSGEGQVVAVIDGEVDLTHPSLANRVVRKGNFSEGAWDSFDTASHLGREHATAVAGIIAGDGKGKDGATAFVGIAPKAIIWNYLVIPLKNNGSAVAGAIEQACFDGARIANVSWGQRRADSDGTSVWTRTAEAAFRLGMLTIKSNGNNGPDPGTVTVPADGANVLAVGAMDPAGSRVHDGSSRGPTKDGRTKPDVVAPGGGMTAPNAGGRFAAVPVPGTSFAAPMVAGLAALLRQKLPTASAAVLRQTIVATCTQVAGADLNTAGVGYVDVKAALDALVE